MPIRVLPTLLVNQIAAGEVVERPASVVKELVENALDAGSTRIEVAIEGGGRDLIRVTDNGGGIPADELPLAVASHATSKIERPEDLIAIGTMGFRGEALASIASVARVSILSRPRDAVAASELLAEGDSITPPRPAAGPPGTTVTVRTLFFNTPARRKFLKTETTEGGKVADVVESLALSHPQVAFVLRSDGRTVLDLPATEDPKRRSLDIVGKELEPKLLTADTTDGGITVWGLVGLPELAKPSAKHIRVHLNGRPIVDRAILHAMREAYRGLIEPSRSPLAVLFLEMDPREVDVNVHPAKTEVRFRQPSAVHQAVMRCVRRALKAADLVPAFDLPPSGTTIAEPTGIAFTAMSSSGGGSFAAGGFARGGGGAVEGWRPIVYSEVAERLGAMPAFPDAAPPMPTLPTVARAVEILQVHNAFVVTQDEQGLLIIDQHALHERVMFEKLLDRIQRGPLERQRLLMPVVLEASGAEMEALGELDAVSERIGLEMTPAGPRSIAVHAFPSFLIERGVEVAPFVRELLGKAIEEGSRGQAEAALAETLDMMACKAAIKAGDRLTIEELRELLAWRERIERSTNCPHGRPTSLRVTIRDLERQFGRS